jgi:ferrous iron transport protein B
VALRLSELHEGEKGVITHIEGSGAFKTRISEMGFVKGQTISVVKNAPLRDPIEYNIMGYDVSLRRREAQNISVAALHEVEIIAEEIPSTIGLHYPASASKEKTIQIALVGNPNSGKTSLFNFASGANEHVGNYAGVTIGTKTAYFKHKDYRIEITDLPGTYSLSAFSPEEQFVRNQLIEERPDVVVNVIDATNLERNLYLTTQLIDLEIPTVIALNMYDEFEEVGSELNAKKLGSMMGIPIIPTVGAKGRGLDDLLNKIIEIFEGKCETSRRVQVHYNLDVENELYAFNKQFTAFQSQLDGMPQRYLALKLIEGDSDMLEWVNKKAFGDAMIQFATEARKRVEENQNDKIDSIFIDARYGFIDGALKRTFIKKGERKRRRLEVDDILTHRVWGYPIFLFIMWLIFEATFVLGQFPMDWIEMAVAYVGEFTNNIMADGPLKSLLINGIIDGVGGVIVFLPNILILFFCISLLEDTGYMARAAFIMDKLMQKMGLQGKSFIPMIMGFGCNVPAIMATRTLENRKHRLLTMLVNPFMSCSARLPVYILVIGAVFPSNQGSILFGLYALGIALAIGLSMLFKTILVKTDNIPFVMELPPYRIPTLRASMMHMWFRSVQYLKKMGGVILVASIIIWALGHYPENVEYSKNFPALMENVELQYLSAMENESTTEAKEELRVEMDTKLDSIYKIQLEEKQEKSFIGMIGKKIEPVMRPLGFDWKMSVSVLTGVAAKEVVISTMAVLYQADEDADEHSFSLMNNLNKQVYTSGPNIGQKVFTPVSAMSFLVFILIYFPCIAVIAAIKNESGRVKWALFTVFYTTALAWLLSFAVFQIGSIFV